MALNKRKVLEAARKHAQKGAKAKALKEYNKLLKEDPRDAKLMLEVGDAYRRWGQNDEAIAQYVKVANQYRQEGFDARAVAVFKQILNLDPKNYGAYVSLSELYQRMGLDSEAAGALQTAADGYHKEGRKTEALELLRQMAALDPTNTTSRLKVAELLRQEGMEGEAVDEYRAVIEELENQQDRDQLVTVIERLLEIKPDDIEAMTRLVRCLMEAGEFPRAEPLAVRALNVGDDIPQHELLMDLYAQMGEEGKLADATRGLAKAYRDRGDEERARELMQRLPAEEVAGNSSSSSSPGLAVDVSEVAEPELGDDELLGDDDDFLSLGDDDGEGDPFELTDDAPLLDLEAEAPAAPEPAAAPAADAGSEELPVPDGEPDQLLAEASVYLRYGKRDQAIASLRGVLAQEPEHRGALEKLGEAYAESDRSEEAVEVWLRAAERIRAEGDGAALSVLKDRIEQLDPAAAAGIEDVAPAAAAPPPVEAVPDLDLDMEIDLDLDEAIEDTPEAPTAGDLVADGGPSIELELDDEALLLDDETGDGVPGVETTMPDVPEAANAADDEDLSFDVGDLGLDASALDDDDDIEVELDAESLSTPPTQTGAGESSATTAKIAEELEEAEFYIGQSMYDEAERLLQGILDVVPNHPSALVRMGEVATAKAAAPDAADDTSDVEATSPTVDFETTARFDDDEDEVAFEIDVDVETDLSMDAQPPPAVETAADSAASLDVELDLDEDLVDEDVSDSTETEDLIASEPEVVEDTGATVEASSAAQQAAEAEDVAVDAAEEAEEAAATDAATAPAVDPGETFDLREALADVFEDDDEPAADANGESQVLSTVEDGFESIFSDFKKGVSAQLDGGDFDTRYDLGIAYREMGLFEDAIGEFRFCLDSPDRRFDSLYLMGLCARDLGRFEDAVSHLEQALALPDLPEDRMAGVYFDLSIAQEGAGDAERACASVRRVIELDADFPGAAERLAALESGESATPQLGEPGEAFESFDDLFSDDDEDGDGDVAESVSAEAFESFDDVVSEAETVLEEAEVIEPAEDPDEDTQSASRRGGRKKISFV